MNNLQKTLDEVKELLNSINYPKKEYEKSSSIVLIFTSNFCSISDFIGKRSLSSLETKIKLLWFLAKV